MTADMTEKQLADEQQPTEPAPESGPAELERGEQAALLTALLFTAGETIAEAQLAEYFGMGRDELTVLAEETAAELRTRGLDILAAAGGYKLVTASQWDEAITAFHRTVRKSRLSKSALEILAVIAYEQPVTRTRVEELRQVSSESTIRTLLERRLITVAGREDTPGRPFLYKTTPLFLETFGLNSLADLPPRPESLDSIATPEEEDEFDAGGSAGLDSLPDFSEPAADDELED
jgi:segregation and condensation protein B